MFLVPKIPPSFPPSSPPSLPLFSFSPFPLPSHLPLSLPFHFYVQPRQPTQPKLPDYGPVFHPEASAPMPGTVSSGWRPFIDEQPGSTLQKPPTKGGKKSFLSQLTTLAYETPALATAGGQYGEGGKAKTKTKSPYLISLVGNKGRGGGSNTASRRKSYATATGMGAQGSPKSGSALGGKAGHNHSPEGKRLSFPRLGASSKETSLPKGAVMGLQGDSETRFSQLEGWVDEKIK